MRPEDVGLAGTSLPLGKHSGRAALRAKLKDLGFDMVDNQLNDLFVRFKSLADRKKEVFDDDLIALVTDAAAADQDDHLELKFLRVICGTEAPQSADITLRVGTEDKQATAQGDGPVDAAFNAVKALYPNEAVLNLYQVSAVTEGMDAQATVTVRIEEDGRIATGQSADTDTVRGQREGLRERAQPHDRGARKSSARTSGRSATRTSVERHALRFACSVAGFREKSGVGKLEFSHPFSARKTAAPGPFLTVPIGAPAGTS